MPAASSTHIGRHAVRIPTKPMLVGIAVAMLSGIGGSLAVAMANDIPAAHAGVIYWVSLSYTLCGLVTWRQWPTNRLGPLMVLAGFSTLATTLSWAGAAGAQTIGQTLDVLPTVVIVHVFLAFPTGRLRHRLDRMLITVGYAAAIGAQLVVMMLGGPGSPSLLAVIDDPDAATFLHNLELVVLSAVAVASVAVLVVRRRAEGRPLRRSLALLIDSFAVGLLMIAALLLVGVFGGPFFPTIQWISLALLGLAPVAFLARLLDTQLARTAVGDLVLKLRAEPADLRTPLAHALRDPSLSVAYWLPQFDSWAKKAGLSTCPSIADV